MAENSSKLYKNGKWNVTNLRFLTDFLSLIGSSTSEAAKRIGYTHQGIYNMLTRDDAKISIIQNIVSAHGYLIEFSFEPKNPIQIIGGAYVNLQDCILDNANPESSGKRLSFFETALSRNGITKKHYCEKMGVPSSTLMYQLRADDMCISSLYKFAEVFDLKFCINFKKLDTKTN